MNPNQTEPQPAVPSPNLPHPLKAFYDPSRKSYLVLDDDENWISVETSAMKIRLAQLGVSPRKAEGATVSAAEAALVRIQQQNSVVYVGPLAGYKRGCYTISGYKVLVTHSPKLVVSVEGDWATIRAVIENQFADPDSPMQTIYFYGWLKVAVEALYNERRKYGQALVLAGPKGCGKSLLQSLVSVILGGRSAKPYRYMMGGTQFNRELFGAEHQMIEDEAASTDPRVRLKFGSAIKMVAATHEHSCHGKGREAIMLTPFWRLTISVNDEPQDLMILPPLRDSLIDKVMVMRSVKHPMPMPTETSEQEEAFWVQLVKEVPAFLHWLRNDFHIPEELRDGRYGVKAYVNPHVLAAIESLSPHTRLLNLIDQVFWTGLDVGGPCGDQWQGTAEEAQNILSQSSYKNEANLLLSWSYAMGTYLGELARNRPDRVRQCRTANSREWIIYRVPQPPE